LESLLANLIALVVSVVALAVSTVVGWRTLVLTRHSNAVPVLVELFGEHRDTRLANAREFVDPLQPPDVAGTRRPSLRPKQVFPIAMCLMGYGGT
jgi:hypothetical protein